VGIATEPKLSDFEYHKDDDLWLHPDRASVDYSDGEEAENRLLRAIRNASDKSVFSPALQEQVVDWVSEYHLSQLRHNLLRHMDFRPGDRILELGAGCGALTRLLGESGAQVTAIEGARARARCAAARCADLPNVQVYCTPFHAASLGDSYDYVTLVGVLEYSPCFFPGDDPIHTCLEMARRALTPRGQLLVAIENRNGLKYLAGMREDHCTRRYAGVEDSYRSGEAVTLGHRELWQALERAGLPHIQFQYPFPDYKLPRAIISERALSHEGFEAGEILARIPSRDYCGPTESTFSESLAWPQFAANGLISDLANSFLVLASRDQTSRNDPDFLALSYNVGNERGYNRRKAYKAAIRFLPGADDGVEVQRERLVAEEPPNQASLSHRIEKEAYCRGPILASLLERDVARVDLEAFTAHLRAWVEHVEEQGIAERHSDRWSSLIDPMYIDCMPENLVWQQEELCFFDREWRYHEPYTLAMLVVRGLSMLVETLGESLGEVLEGQPLARLCELVGLEGDLETLVADVERHERAIYQLVFESFTEPEREATASTPTRGRRIRSGLRRRAGAIVRHSAGLARTTMTRAREALKEPPADERAAVLRALDWTRAQALPGGGIAVSDCQQIPYPEVTGYLIPTLMDWGEHDLASRFAAWLVSVQHEDGSWLSPSGVSSYTFDTGQVLKGLIALLDREPGLEDAVQRGCQWMMSQICDTGRVTTPDKSQWVLPGGLQVPESIHLYTLEALRLAGHRFGETRYLEAVERACSYYTAQYDLVDFQTLAHFHAYVLEALIDLDCRADAERGMATVANIQRRSGAIPAAPGVGWVCLPALAQYAVSWFKLGEREPALRALARLTQEQRPSGGFYGSIGRGAQYFPTEEPSWAVKFFLDAQTWRIRTSFDDGATVFPETVPANDGRLRAIEHAMPENENPRVLDAGCGKGRFAAALRRTQPAAEIWGVDLSPAMLNAVADGIHTRQGSLLNLPFRDGEFDFVFCVEALEHSVNAGAALRELTRVTRPGGSVLVIDKDAQQSGALEISPWERWFERSEVESWLLEGCDVVSSEYLSDPKLPEKLFIAWRGRVREAGRSNSHP